MSMLTFEDISTVLTNVPDVVQSTGYTCGPASCFVVLRYYGITKYDEGYIAHMAGTTEQDGTDPSRMVEFFVDHGFETDHGRMTVDDLKHYIDGETPIIVLFQAWADETPDSYIDEWNAGHYAVVIGYNNYGFILEDPWVKKKLRVSYEEFTNRWHAKEGDEQQYAIAARPPLT